MSALPAVPAGARIGLLGGSFDPIHCAHLRLAEAARDELGLHAVWLIPAGQPWQRDPLAASPEHRRAMVALAIADHPHLALCDVELRRQGPSYTIDTLRELRAARPDLAFTFILGADQLINLPTWNGWAEIAAQVDLAYAPRPGWADTPPAPLHPALAAHGHALHRLRMAPVDLSATRVRERLAHGQPLGGLVPPPVAAYIAQHRLYAA